MERLVWYAFILLGSLLATLPAGAQESDIAQSVTQQVSAGAVHLTLAAERQTMGLADRLRVTLRVEAPPGVRVTLPESATQLGPFIVHRHRTLDPQTTAAQTQHWQQEYLLEAETVGEATIPPLTVSFQDTEAPATAPAQQLTTEPLTITVTSIVPEDADLTVPKDIAPPVALAQRGMPRWVWIGLGVLGGLGLLLGAWWYWRRRQQAAMLVPPQPAHVLALEALQRLQQEDLIAQGRVETFYVRLSDILRHYIGWRFGLRAPERTTEEFLTALLDRRGPIAAHREALSTFLQHCDLVKFARHQPGSGDMQQAFDSAQAFVQQTADEQVTVAVSLAGALAS